MSFAQDPDVVTIVVGNQTLSGWQNVRVQRSIEHFPSTFDLELTEKYPLAPMQIVVNPGDPITLSLGADTVLTGYVDTYEASMSAESHTVRIAGRSKCEDFHDCSAGEAPYQLANITLGTLAKQLAKPFGITVSLPDGDSQIIPTVSVTLTETPYELVELYSRWANFLVYDDTNGNLVLGKVGSSNAASGFSQGANVQSAAVSYDMQQRFTQIQAIYLSTGFLIDGPPAAGSSIPVLPIVQGAQAKDTSFPPRSDKSPRFRQLLIVSEQTQNLSKQAALRAQWDMARRIGRSQAVRITVDNWRDKAGALWRPNTLAPINLPALKLVNATWLISTVVYVRGEQGTTCEVTLMPPSAFVPEPNNLQPFDRNVASELPGGGAQNTAPAPR